MRTASVRDVNFGAHFYFRWSPVLVFTTLPQAQQHYLSPWGISPFSCQIVALFFFCMSFLSLRACFLSASSLTIVCNHPRPPPHLEAPLVPITSRWSHDPIVPIHVFPHVGVPSRFVLRRRRVLHSLTLLLPTSYCFRLCSGAQRRRELTEPPCAFSPLPTTFTVYFHDLFLASCLPAFDFLLLLFAVVFHLPLPPQLNRS